MVRLHAENLKLAKSFGPCQPTQTAHDDMGIYTFCYGIKVPFHRAKLKFWFDIFFKSHSHTMTPFDGSGEEAF